MYREYWGLRTAPFRLATDVDLFRGAPQEEALARLEFVMDHDHRTSILVGESGSGRSTLLRAFAAQLRNRTGTGCCYLSAIGRDCLEFTKEMVRGLGGLGAACGSAADVWNEIHDQLLVLALQELRMVVICDDLQFASYPIQLAILRLAQWRSQHLRGPTVILSCTNQGLGELVRPLWDVCPFRVELEAWSLEDTVGYITDSLRNAGRTEPAFEPLAIQEIHRLSAGLPRRVVQLAEMSLIVGAAERCRSIHEQIVQELNHELAIPVAADLL